MNNDIEVLQNILGREDAILFVGSGISLWSGLPTWPGLIDELAYFIERLGHSSDLMRAEAARGDLLQAASYGFTKLTQLQIGEFVRSACRSGASEPSNIHEKLVNLAPRCYITTNYDDLLEQSLRTWRPEVKFGTSVTNRNITAIADIIQARRTDFVFKPHGDAYDTESIVLTREQYRKLLPQGERHAALDALKTLMVTRPVVYFGFGLRDPDFLYLRDIISNIYTGGNIDHYAVVADVGYEEKVYWRNNFGLHLMGYETLPKADGKRDHSPLLKLIDKLGRAGGSRPVNSVSQSDMWLSLARYAAGLSRRWPLEAANNLPVYVEKKDGRHSFHARISVDDFLLRDVGKALLLGAPGAGKSHSFGQCVKKLASELQSQCLSADLPSKSITIPIYCDLKLYDGDLLQLIGQQLPPNISLESIVECFSVRIYIDSFNEMPIEFREGKNFHVDFEKSINALSGSTIYIGSRNSDGLEGLAIPEYELSDYAHDDLEKYIEQNEIILPEFHRFECLSILRRPIYFNLFNEGKVAFSDPAHPIDLYVSLMKSITERFHSRFGVKSDLLEMLATLAAGVLDSGQEAFSAEIFLHYSKWIGDTNLVDPVDILNWFIAERFIVTHPGNRISFFHQSITEFLAATHLSNMYENDLSIITDKLKFKRWDQALFLCSGILNHEKSTEFVDNIISADVFIAIRSSRYVEHGRSKIVSQILDFLQAAELSFDQRMKINWAISHSLPADLTHINKLKRLMETVSELGEGISRLLVQIDPDSAKDYLLPYFINKPDDFNLLVNGIGPALATSITEQDVKTVADWCDHLEASYGLEKSLSFSGFLSGIRPLLKQLETKKLRELLMRNQNDISQESLRRHALSSVIEYRKSASAMKLAVELLEVGHTNAAYCIHSNKMDDEADCYFFTTHHVDLLLCDLVQDRSWAYAALGDVCRARPDLASYAQSKANESFGLKRAAILKAAGSSQDAVFDALSELFRKPNESANYKDVGFLRRLELDWGGHEKLLVDLLRLRNKDLAKAIFGGSIPPSLGKISSLEIGDFSWWIDWMVELSLNRDNYWLLEQIGWFAATNIDKEVIIQTAVDFYKSDTRRSLLIISTVINRIPLLEFDDFPDSLISILLDRLSSGKIPGDSSGNILANIATERFTVTRIIPLLNDRDIISKQAIVRTLQRIGSRLGRRFVGDDGTLLSE